MESLGHSFTSGVSGTGLSLQGSSSASARLCLDEHHQDTTRHDTSLDVADIKLNRFQPPICRTHSNITPSDGVKSPWKVTSSIDDGFLSNKIMIDDDVNIHVNISGILFNVTDRNDHLSQASSSMLSLRSIDLVNAQLPGCPHNQVSAVSCYFENCFQHSTSSKLHLQLKPQAALPSTAYMNTKKTIHPLSHNGTPGACLHGLAASNPVTCSMLEMYLRAFAQLERISLGIASDWASDISLLPPELLQTLASIEGNATHHQEEFIAW